MPSGNSLVAISVLKPDGSAGTVTDRQRTLLDAATQLLQADHHFQGLNAPTLSRAEVNEGLAETAPGYLYLRFEVSGAAPQEFWAHWGAANRVAWTSGNVTVRAASASGA